jgi:hypothetical protein
VRWNEHCLIVTSFTSRNLIFLIGYRIDAGVTNPTPIAIADSEEDAVPYFTMPVSIAWDGSGFQVFYEGHLGDRLFKRRILLDGTIEPVSDLGTGVSPHVSCGPASCLAVWWKGMTLLGQRFGVAGPVGATFTIASLSTSSTNWKTARVVWAGDRYWVTWMTDTGALRGARVSATGTVLDPAGIAITETFLNSDSLAFDGTNAIVTWRVSTGSLRLARLTPAGEVLDPGGFELGPSLWAGPPACADGSCVVVAGMDGRESVVGMRVIPGTGTMPMNLDPVPRAISTAVVAQGEPTVDGHAGRYATAWIAGSDEFAVRGTIFSPGLEAPQLFEAERTPPLPGAMLWPRRPAIALGASRP